MEFSVVQSAPGQGPAVAGGVVWRTCLREIAFVANGSPVPDTVDAFQDEAAYAHLLDGHLRTGIADHRRNRSDVAVQGLRRRPDPRTRRPQGLERAAAGRCADRARAATSPAWVALVWQRGAAPRQGVDRVALIGTGMLAQEILPFVLGDGRVVDLWGRRESLDWNTAGATYRRLDDADGPRSRAARPWWWPRRSPRRRSQSSAALRGRDPR